MVAAQLQRAQPDRLHPHAALEELEERVAALHWDLDVLDDHLARRATPVLVEHRGQAVLLVEGDELAVDVGAAVPARPEAPDDLVLHAERAGAPEPVGVPAPDVALDGEEVLAGLLDRLVVDL